MSLIDRVKEQYDAKGTGQVEVPEWGENGVLLVVYFTPMNIDQQNKLARLAKDGNSIAAIVDMVIMKAQDANGDKLFTKNDKHTLLHRADTDVLVRIVESMRTSTLTEEEAEGE